MFQVNADPTTGLEEGVLLEADLAANLRRGKSTIIRCNHNSVGGDYAQLFIAAK